MSDPIDVTTVRPEEATVGSGNNGRSIPKIIHRMWLQKGVDPNPEKYPMDPNAYLSGPKKYEDEKYIPSFLKHNPDFVHKIWNTKEIYDLFWYHPKLARYRNFFFDCLKYMVHRCDFARLALLLVYGGIYYDLDFICYRSLNELIQDRTFFWSLDIGCHDQGYLKQALSVIMENRSSILTAAMGSVPFHGIVSELMEFFMRVYHPDIGAMGSGPAMAGRFAREYGLTVDEHPELFVDSRLIVSSTWFKTKMHFWKQKPVVKPFTSTLISDGTDWGGEKFGMTAYPIVKIVLLLIVTVLLFVFIVKTIYKLKRDKEQCTISTTGQSKMIPNDKVNSKVKKGLDV